MCFTANGDQQPDPLCPAAGSITNHLAGAGLLPPQTLIEGSEVWGSAFLQPISRNLFALVETLTSAGVSALYRWPIALKESHFQSRLPHPVYGNHITQQARTLKGENKGEVLH